MFFISHFPSAGLLHLSTSSDIGFHPHLDFSSPGLLDLNVLFILFIIKLEANNRSRILVNKKSSRLNLHLYIGEVSNTN